MQHKAICGNAGYVAVFAGNDEEGYRYYAGSGSMDSRELAAKMREALGAKGGVCAGVSGKIFVKYIQKTCCCSLIKYEK